jgi:hypothetical protein
VSTQHHCQWTFPPGCYLTDTPSSSKSHEPFLSVSGFSATFPQKSAESDLLSNLVCHTVFISHSSLFIFSAASEPSFINLKQILSFLYKLWRFLCPHSFCPDKSFSQYQGILTLASKKVWSQWENSSTWCCWGVYLGSSLGGWGPVLHSTFPGVVPKS